MQIEERFVAFGAGLASIGIPPGQSSLVGIYGPNSVEVHMYLRYGYRYSHAMSDAFENRGTCRTNAVVIYVHQGGTGSIAVYSVGKEFTLSKFCHNF